MIVLYVLLGIVVFAVIVALTIINAMMIEKIIKED